MKVLSIVEAGYRAAAEEQDDTIVWLNTMCRDAGLDVTLVLCGEAVNYGVAGHDPQPVMIGGSAVATPPVADSDLADLAGRDVEILYIDEDRAELGISEDGMTDVISPIKRHELAALCAAYDQVWHW